ncbi:DNA cytosine methyltransferase [Patescibacteria group bacterium]|nr:DNA cytosine methyltransferase [Patescibacteria group bacterium]MBU1911710.1 DNA cytosine methyltransferase [Patescibacteria group bacterium]
MPDFTPTAVSLFSGCGGLDLGFIEAGFKIIWANDNEDIACKTYEKYIGNHIVCGDINKIDINSIPKADILIGGPPCQDFSVIWKQPGLKGKRGQLLLSYLKVLDHVKPKAFVIENVKGLKSMQGGAILEFMLGELRERGYERISAKVYNFADYGVPQLRQRLVIVGVRDDVPIDFIEPKPTHIGKHVASSKALKGAEKVPFNNEHQNIMPKTRKLLSLIPEGGNFASVPKDHPLYVKGMISHVYRRLHSDKPSTTIIAAGGGGTWGYHYEENRPLTNRERARLFTFPDDMEFLGTIAQARKQIGNAVPPKGILPIAKNLYKLLYDCDQLCQSSQITTATAVSSKKYSKKNLVTV